MPAPGEQHLSHGGTSSANPFEEAKPRVSEYTAQEIATLQSRLEKQLGPEYISTRAGPGGGRIHYLAAEKCIQLANEVFGFNGWSSSIMNIQVDFVDENPTTLKINLGLSVIVRVTLRDGTFHEDIGYGHIENCKGKAAAFEKAKKEGTTDALKRALRNFGNVLGNCIYDKEYLAKVTKVKVQPNKWDVEGLHRHSDYVPLKKEPAPVAQDVKQEANSIAISTLSTGDSMDILDDEFGDFDEADFSVPRDPESHPDEVALPAIPAQLKPQHLNNSTEPRTSRVGGPPPQLQPQTPHNALTRSTSGAGNGLQKRAQDVTTNARPPPGAPIVAGRVLHQPSRMGGLSAPASPTHQQSSTTNRDELDLLALPPGPVGAGFFSAKAITMLPEGTEQNGSGPPPPASNLPAFNVHAESPSIRKTPGIDHKRSKPLTKDLKHVPASSQQPVVGAAGQVRSNVVNPQMETTRRIGAPGAGSPLANRGQYKPPTMKRPMDGGNAMMRPPLGDIPANGNVPVVSGGGDPKRQRLSDGT